jgi:type II secretory ATPase GspE/PulE/Tfp pilus assembly ATPase PilB-like protein
MPPRILEQLKVLLKRPQGLILVTGPTGSGKTTTLYAALHHIFSSEINVVTIEDPIEYSLPGVNQVQVNPATELTFAKGLRSLLRQDPDVIMIGEIRGALAPGADQSDRQCSQVHRKGGNRCRLPDR